MLYPYMPMYNHYGGDGNAYGGGGGVHQQLWLVWQYGNGDQQEEAAWYQPYSPLSSAAHLYD